MRVTLIYNPKAGKGRHKPSELIRRLGEAGHETICHSIKTNDYKKALKKKADVVLVAGGDGAVGKVARRLIGRGTPLSVLPFGTANNLARSLGFAESTPGQIIASLDRGSYCTFDAGHVIGPWKKRYFFEGAGGGLLPDYLAELVVFVKEINETHPVPTEREMKRHVAMLRHLVETYEAREWQVKLDGKDVSGRYLLLEAMNIRAIGPVLTLAPQARTDDGYLNFVAVREKDRRRLCDFLNARLRHEKIAFPFRSQRFRHLEITWDGAPLHFDDDLWPGKKDKVGKGTKLEITINPAALTILLPEAVKPSPLARRGRA